VGTGAEVDPMTWRDELDAEATAAIGAACG
jgi:hypothetical protein